jgi:hypothetical protein
VGCCGRSPRGVLVIKDVTSIISANRDLRATVLAALREVYDGRWSRNMAQTAAGHSIGPAVSQRSVR